MSPHNSSGSDDRDQEPIPGILRSNSHDSKLLKEFFPDLSKKLDKRSQDFREKTGKLRSERRGFQDVEEQRRKLGLEPHLEVQEDADPLEDESPNVYPPEIVTELSDNRPVDVGSGLATAGPYQTPAQRKSDLEKAYDFVKGRLQFGSTPEEIRRIWILAKQKYPDLSEDQTFSTAQKVKDSIPDVILQQRSSHFWLARKGQPGRYVRAKRFFDTGNLVGPMISKRFLVEELGYDLKATDDVDPTDRVRFMGATGDTTWTLGKVKIVRSLDPDGSDAKVIEPQVWDDKVNLADVMFGADEDAVGRTSGDEFPPLCPFIPKPITKGT